MRAELKEMGVVVVEMMEEVVVVMIVVVVDMVKLGVMVTEPSLRVVDMTLFIEVPLLIEPPPPPAPKNTSALPPCPPE
jgi:hypothetical protein